MSKSLDIEWTKKLAEKMKQAREDASFTQEELAKLARTSRQTIIKYEKEGVPFVEIFARIAAELETTFRIGDFIITVERISPRLRTITKPPRLDFEPSQPFPNAVIIIPPNEGPL